MDPTRHDSPLLNMPHCDVTLPLPTSETNGDLGNNVSIDWTGNRNIVESVKRSESEMNGGRRDKEGVDGCLFWS